MFLPCLRKQIRADGQKNDLWANTDGKTGKKKQFLEEHLVRVCEQATHIAHRLPYFSDQMESVYDVKALTKKKPGSFQMAGYSCRENQSIPGEEWGWCQVFYSQYGKHRLRQNVCQCKDHAGCIDGRKIAPVYPCPRSSHVDAADR